MWQHLERLGGGIGTRGPGETQLETDRRIARDRVALLKRELALVEKERRVQRQARANEYRVAIVGYTNAGKSTLFNALTRAHVRAEDRLFATLDATTRRLVNPAREVLLLTDTVGFIRKLPHHLVASFRATLEEAREADVLLHVVDASHPDWEGQIRVVEKVLAELDLADRPTIVVFNKLDAVRDPAAFAARARALYPDAVLATTMRIDGLDALRARLRGLERAGRVTARIRLPASDGARVAELYRVGEVMAREEQDNAVELTVRLEEWQLDRLRREGVAVTAGRPRSA
jgi:GTP-binding protein HflX